MEIPAANHIAQFSSDVVETLGVLLILFVSVNSLIHAVVLLAKHVGRHEIFKRSRYRLARGMLSGLELLVAADIIKTVALEFTFESVGVLALIILIRSFLSATLELEMTGKWPWQQKNT